MSKENISIWVHKQLTGQLSAAEQEELDKALSADATHRQLARDVQAVWEKTEAVGDDVQFDAGKAYQRFKASIAAQSEKQSGAAPLTKSIQSSGGARRVFLRYATAAAAVLVMGFFAMKFFNSSNSLTIESGSTAMVAGLPDGSQVRMAAHSSIKYNTEKFATDRKVQLTGSAIFEVQKTGSSFEVSADNMKVSVLGTTFLVKNEGKSKEVKVLEGKVVVQTNPADRVEITDKQGVVIENGVLSKIDEINFSDLSWSDPEMVYNNEPLSRVISDIESKFGVKISAKGSADLEKCTFTSGSLKNNTLEEILSLLEATYSTKISKKSPGEYQISGLSCS